MVAPKYGSPEPFSTGAAQDAASTRNDKRREEILLRLISDANEDRMEGNALFKDRSFDDALAKYSKAIHTLQKLPKKMASKDMAKALNNRGRAYVKLALMTLAEADASEVLSMGTVEPASKAAAFLVRYHARVGLGAKQKAAQDLNRSADLGNMDAQKMLLLPSAKKGKTNGGFQGACSSDDPPRTGVVAQGGIGGGGSFSTQPGALKPSTASVDVSVSAMAAGKGPGASADVKLKARPDAGAGEELTFGGPRGCSSWGQHPVPEVGGSPPRSRSPQRSQEGGNAVAATGLPVAGENAATPTRRIEAAGYAKGPDDVGGANGTGGVCDGRGEGGGGSGDACTTTNFLEVPRRRRPRPGSPGKGNVTTVSFTPSVPMTAAGEDTFPAPHPVLAHASVRRCFVLAPTGDGGSSGGTIVDGGEAVATVGDTESDSVGKVSSSGIGDAVSDVVLGAGRQGVGFNRELGPGQGLRGTPGCRESGGEGAGSRAGDEQGSRREEEGRVGGGGGDDKIGGRKGKNGAPAVGLVEGENEGPPPAKQAQDIRWLVAQAKEEPREGDVWAVVDRQWWLRWQRFTGCEEGAASGEDAEETAHAAAEDADAQSSAAVAAAAVAAASAAAAPGQEDIRSAAPAGVDVEVESGGRRRNEVDAGDGGGGGGGSGDVARESDSSPREGKQANDNNNENSIGGGRTSEEGVHPSSSLEAVVSSATVGIGASPENSGDVVEVGDRGVGGQSHRVTAGGREAAGGEMTDCEKRSDSFVTPDASGEIAKASAAIAAEDLRKTGGSDGGGGGVSGSGGGGDSSVPLNGVAGTNGELKGAASATATATAATTTAAIASSSAAEAAALSALVAKAEAAAVPAVAAPAVAATAVPPPLRAPPPGPINNSALVMSARTPGTVPGSGRRLRLHLVRGYHFVLVPQEAWKALHAWYGGGPALPRSLVPVRDSESGRFVCEPQLYPEFSLLDPELQRSLASSSAAVPRDTARPEFKEASTSSSSSSSSPYASSFTSSSSSSCSSSSSSSPSSSSHRQPPPAKQLAKSVDTGGGEGSRDGCGGGGSTATTTTTSTSLNGSLPAAPIHDPPSEPTIEKGEGFVEAKGGEQAADGVGSERREERRREETPHPPAAAAAVAAAAAAAGQRSCAACGRPARAKCNACLKNSHKVFYCSKECQSAHWRFHKQLCGGSRSDPEAGLAMAKRGKAGLANLGNTCFLSSAVQCLSHVQPLTRHILTNAFLRDLNTTNPLGTGGRLVRAYETVLKDLWFGSGKTVSPAALKSAIAQFAPQFNGFSQQDSQEVLSFLLDGLHEDLNRVLKKPYLILPDGECGRPDAVIAAQSWEMFKMRDRSVLVDSLYGQFKSTLECPQCGKLSRKFDEFNVMPVELLDGQRLHVLLDFAPFLAPSKIAVSGNNGTPSAATILGGLGAEGRRQRRIGVLLPKGARVSDLKEELSAMFKIGLDEMVIVVVPVSGQTIYRLLPDSAEVLPFTQGYDITAHQCVPGQRHALVVNRVFHGGSFVTFSEEMLGRFSPADWTKELDSLARLKYEDKEAPFLVSFPEGISCLRLIKEVWMHTPDLFHLLKERVEDPSFVHVLASTGHVKLSEASNSFAPRFARMDHNQAQRQAKLDEENGVVVTNTGRYVPPFENIPAAAVLDTRGARREGLDFFHLDWSGLMLQNMNRERISEPFAARDHVSVQETAQRAKRVSLQDCLQKFSVPETLCEDNSWHCGNCKELRQAVKTIQVWSLPEVLILHFKRFSHVGPNRGKVELFVDFPINGLDMSSYCRGETLEGGRPMSALYDLFAVSNHMGDMAHGHYTAYVRDWEGGGMSDKWYVCDDEDCLPVDESRVRTQHAYVLFYRRRPLA